MNEISTVAASAHFVAGLTLVALAAMIWLRFGKRAPRVGGGWALPVLPALALAEWCQLPLVSPSVGQFVRLALLSLALVGMVEFALRFTGRRGGLLPRWSYLALVGLALVLFPWVGPTWLELGLRLTIAWQAIWLAASYSGLGEDAEPGRADGASRLAVPPGSLAGQAIIGGLLVGLLAAVVALPLVEMLALVVAAAAGYFGLSPIAVTPRSQLVCALRLAGRLFVDGRRGMFAAGHPRRGRDAHRRAGSDGRCRRQRRSGSIPRTTIPRWATWNGSRPSAECGRRPAAR